LRRLIINADDFGLTRGVNQAILEAHSKGVITSATMMANSSAFDHALQLAQSNPSLAIGCHVVLIDGTPVLPPQDIPDLIEPDTDRFYSSLTAFGRRVLRNRISPDQIEAEATAQIRKLQQAGINVTHLDTHKHTHIFPQLLDPVLRAARACGVPAIRKPFEPFSASFLIAAPRTYKRWLQTKLLRVFLGHFLRATKQSKIFTTSGTVGIAATGILDQRLFARIANGLPEGLWELVCHPGYDDQDLRQASTRLLQSRKRELEILTSSTTKEVLERRGIQLISYRDIRFD
jgi:hopanoid biosynthesis associated protein HpnK